LDLRTKRLRILLLLFVRIVRNNASTFTRESSCQSMADTGTTAGDDRHLILELDHNAFDSLVPII